MTEQLSADDWIKEGLKALGKGGFTALKADPLAKASDEPLKALLRRTFGARLDLERAVRNWAAFDAAAQAAVRAIDRRRLDYIEALLERRGLAPAMAQARAQILYWTFLGFALSGPPLPAARLKPLLDEILRMVSA